MKRLAALLIVLANLTALAAGQTATNSLVKGPACPTLTWEPSMDGAVTGYYVRYGDLAQATTQVVEVRNAHSLTLTNLAANATNFIYVTSHDATGAESDASDVLLYCPTAASATVAAPSVAAPPRATALTLSVRQASATVRFPVAAGIRYHLQASTDLKMWTTVGVAEPEVAGISEYADPNAVQSGQRFYRVVTEEPQALALR